jgi:hypothetical protein
MLEYDETLSNLAFKFNLCRYTQAAAEGKFMDIVELASEVQRKLREEEAAEAAEFDARGAGAHTRPLLSSASAVLVSGPFRVQVVTSHIYSRYPTYPTTVLTLS